MSAKKRRPQDRSQRWPESRVEKLKALVRQGNLSKTQIAMAISEDGGHPITRNSICGKMDRLGLKNESRRPKMKMGPAFARLFSEKSVAHVRDLGFNGHRLSITSQPMIDALNSAQPRATRKGIPFIGSGMFQCKFLLGDHLVPNPRCCGKPTLGTTSWCREHIEIVADPRSALRRT